MGGVDTWKHLYRENTSKIRNLKMKGTRGWIPFRIYIPHRG